MATKRRVTVQEAADMLGISQEAVRMRVKRGTLKSEKRGGRVYILFGTDPTQDQTQDQTTDQGGRIDELRNRVTDLQDQVEMLRSELADWKEEARRKDHLIAAALERIPPQIEPPRDEQESPSEAAPRSDEGVGTQEPERPFWRRWFRG